MPAQRAILHDILVNKLNPNKPHADLSKTGKLKSEEQPKISTKESLYAATKPVILAQEEVKNTLDEAKVSLSEDVVTSTQEELQDKNVDVVVESAEEPTEEKPKKKLFQKKKLKDDVIL